MPDPWWPLHEDHHAIHGTDPAEEVAIGAVLVQNTAWAQVQRAIANLVERGPLSLTVVGALPHAALTDLVRPAGFVQRKPATLQRLATLWADAGGSAMVRASVADDPDPFRQDLLDVHGIGPETADAILLYGFGSRVFVVDAYTRRLMDRLGVRLDAIHGSSEPTKASYDAIAAWWRRGLPRDAERYARAHALIVEHMKRTCTRVPKCHRCPLADRCATARTRSV